MLTKTGAPGARPIALRVVLAAVSVALIAGCETLSYYAQAVGGHLDMLSRARPVEDVVIDPATPKEVRAKLESARKIREFATGALGLPDNGSYRRYADLDRPYVVWNVFAAPEFSTRPVESCFPVAGCVTYRGFFSETDAKEHAQKLRAAGNDVHFYGVPAYSTLGWFDDPMLSTFIRYPESELARLVFHELAHQVVYVKGDTVFNESFAVAVEREGVRRWLGAQKRDADLTAFLAARERQREFVALIEAARARLERTYSLRLSRERMREVKRLAFEDLKREYDALKVRWGGFAGYDRIIGSEPNNALLASIAAYSRLVPGFERMIDDANGDMPRFYAAVKQLTRLSARERCASLSPEPSSKGC